MTFFLLPIHFQLDFMVYQLFLLSMVRLMKQAMEQMNHQPQNHFTSKQWVFLISFFDKLQMNKFKIYIQQH